MKKHIKLYNAIPEVNCDRSCNDCCGPVPLSAYEAEKLGVPGEVMTPIGKDGTCVFSGPAGCMKYEDRPFLCRLYGSVNGGMMKCPRTSTTCQKPLSQKQADILSCRYKKLVHG